MEFWKDIKEYEGFYQVSDLGRVKSLERKTWNKKNNSYSTYKEKILAKRYAKGYLVVCLSNKIKIEHKYIHVLVAESFLNHTQSGHKKVIDHINSNKEDNRLINLRIVSHRENLSYGYLNKKTSSKYTGVCWDKTRKKWLSNIYIKGFHKYLGRFDNEYDAHLAYQNALENLL